MAGRETIKSGWKHVRPLMSCDRHEAHTRMLGLYRAIYRYIPYIVRCFDIPKSEEQCRCKLRELFYNNANICDVRVIDLLVIKGYMELKEIRHQWAQKGHIMAYWHPTLEPQPTSFVDKFFANKV